jgi:ABC-type nitrate/sulfonate/bicarbonate transport system permease component
MKGYKPDILYSIGTVVIVIVLWEIIAKVLQVPAYILPRPSQVTAAFFKNFDLIMQHLAVTLYEVAVGIVFSVLTAFTAAILMDNFETIKKTLYPLLVISQTIPIMAVAPLLIIWFGFGALPKILLIIIMCFFPIAVSLITGFAQTDKDCLDMFRVLKASKLQIYRHLKFPNALPYFFSGLKISVTWMVMAAVISEWLGGNKGIGVYMLRSKQAFALDNVFASVVLVVFLSLLFIGILNLFTARLVHWNRRPEH